MFKRYILSSFEEVQKHIDTQSPLFFDTETIGLYGTIRLVQFYQNKWDGVVYIIEYPDVQKLCTLLNTCVVVGYALGYDISTIQIQENCAYWCPSRMEDVFYLSRLYYDTAYSDEPSFSLDVAVKTQTKSDVYAEFGGKKNAQKIKWDVAFLTDKELRYASYDVYYLDVLYTRVKVLLKDESYMLDMLTLRENLCMQNNGIPINRQYVQQRYQDNCTEIKKYNIGINVRSYKQVRAYTNLESSDNFALTHASLQGNEKALHVLAVRKRLKENEFLEKYMSCLDNRLRGKFSPSTRSGRCSSSYENLQNIPRTLRNCFQTDIHSVFVYSDFSQLELRCACVLCPDITMYKLFVENKDIHSYTAQNIFYTDTPTQEQRRIAKNCNFGLLYGGGASMLCSLLLTTSKIRLSLEEAENIIKKWKEVWKGITAWQKRGLLAFDTKEMWCTPLGRRYRGKVYSEQLNIQVQGMGAEVAKLANYYMSRDLKECANDPYLQDDFRQWYTWQCNFIHDAYLFVVPNKKHIYTLVSHIIRKSMQRAWEYVCRKCTFEKNVPMPVEVKRGTNWGDIENGVSFEVYEEAYDEVV